MFASLLAALLATEGGYGYAIDEATYRWVAAEERLWFAELGAQPLAQSFSSAGIARRWHFLEDPAARPAGRHSNFNLPASVHVLNLGWLLGHRWRDELGAARLGSMLLFAATGAALFLTLAKSHGWTTGGAAALAWGTSPRLFAHAHFAATETALVCGWMLALLALLRADGWRRAILFGICLGAALATKLTAWWMLPALVVWAALFRPPGILRAAVCGVLLAPIVLVALTPNLWHDPVGGLLECARAARANPWRIPLHYAGATSTAPPATAGVAIFWQTTPLAWLALAAAGMWQWRDRTAALFALNLAMLLGARTAGLVPFHDGERQFLPAFGFVAALAGSGAGRLARRFPRGAWLAFAFLAAEPLAESWRHRQHGLQYWNLAAGGLPGAAAAGHDLAYWSEMLTPDAWKDLLAPCPPGSRVFLRPDHPGAAELQAWGWMPKHVRWVDRPEDADFLLLTGRLASLWLPQPNGTWVRTDWSGRFAGGGALREVRFRGVRLAALFPVRGRAPQ